MPRIPIDSAATAFRPHLVGDPELENLALAEHRIRNDVIARELAVSGAWLDGTQRLFPDATDSPAPETPSAAAFALDADRRRAETVRQAPLHLRQSIDDAIRPVNAQLAERAAQAEATKRTIERVENIHRIRDNYMAIATRDPTQLSSITERVDRLVEELPYPEARRQAMRTEMREAVAVAVLQSLFVDPGAVVAALKGGEFDSLLSPETKKAWMERAEQRLIEEWDDRANRTQIDLTAAAQQGLLDLAALDEAIEQGFLSHEQKSWFLETDAAARTKRAEREASVERVRLADRPFGPDAPQAQADVDAHWEKMRTLLASDDPAEQRTNELAYVKRYGVLPTALRNVYVAHLHASEPALRVDAALALARIEAIEPSLLRDVPPDLRELAQAMARLDGTGLPPAEIVQIAEQEAEERRTALEEATELPPTDPSEEALTGDTAQRPEAPRRTIQTPKEFIDLLYEFMALGEREAKELALAAGIAPASMRLAQRMFNATALSAEEREAELANIGAAIEALPVGFGKSKKDQLRYLLEAIAPVMDNPDLVLETIAHNRGAFITRSPLIRPSEDPIRSRLRKVEEVTGLKLAVVVPDDGTEGPEDGRSHLLQLARRRVAFYRPGSEEPIMTLPATAVREFAADPKRYAEALELFVGLLTGELQDEAIHVKARRLFIKTRRFHYQGHLHEFPDDEVYQAFLMLKETIDQGFPRDPLISAFLPLAFPEIADDENLLIEIALDIAPVVGEYRSGRAAQEHFRRMKEALEHGELRDAVVHAFEGIAAAFTAMPFVAFSLRTARVLAIRLIRNPRVAEWLRTTEYVKTAHASGALRRAMKRIDHAAQHVGPEAIFKELDKKPEEERSVIVGVWSNFIGRAVEQEVIGLFRNLGVKIVERQNQRTIATDPESPGRKGDRVFDVAFPLGLQTVFDLFVFPDPDARGTVVEVKLGDNEETFRQRLRTALIEERIRRDGYVLTKAAGNEPAIEIDTFRLLGRNLRDIPEGRFVALVQNLYRPHVRGLDTGRSKRRKRLSLETYEYIVQQAREWHRQLRHEPMPELGSDTTVGEALVQLAILAFESMEADFDAEDNVSGTTEPMSFDPMLGP